jgi:hypothetical protein
MTSFNQVLTTLGDPGASRQSYDNSPYSSRQAFEQQVAGRATLAWSCLATESQISVLATTVRSPFLSRSHG